MIKIDTLTPSAALQGPSASSAVHQSTPASAPSPRLASGIIVSILAVACLLFASIASAQATGLENPLNSQFNTIPTFIAGALKVLVIVALPIITLFIVVAGFMFVAARGNESKLTEAKKNLMYVIIGALLILGAWVIATLIGGTVTQLVGN